MIEEYKKTEIEGKLTFSGSNLNNYLYNPKLFWDRVYNRELFIPTKETILGTIVHYCANQYLTTKQVKKQEILSYLTKFDEGEINYVLEHYEEMGNQLFEYLDKLVFGNISFESEKTLTTNISKYGVLTGTCDLIVNNTLIDFKTTSKLSEVDKLPMNYIKQLQAYYYLCHKNDIKIDYAKIVFISVPRVNTLSEKTGKALKDYPCKVYEVGLDMSFLDIEKIESLLNHIGESIDFIMENPKLEHLITRNGVDYGN